MFQVHAELIIGCTESCRLKGHKLLVSDLFGTLFARVACHSWRRWRSWVGWTFGSSLVGRGGLAQVRGVGPGRGRLGATAVVLGGRGQLSHAKEPLNRASKTVNKQQKLFQPSKQHLVSYKLQFLFLMRCVLMACTDAKGRGQIAVLVGTVEGYKQGNLQSPRSIESRKKVWWKMCLIAYVVVCFRGFLHHSWIGILDDFGIMRQSSFFVKVGFLTA